MSWDTLKHWFEDLVYSDDDPDHCTVTVHKGDFLRKIAERELGDEERYKEIVDANPDHYWDSNYTIYPGDKLRMPKSWVH
jgi:nucleoid-associated protein YgaU